jgi:lysozyme
MAPVRELTKQGELHVRMWEGDIPYVYDDAVYPTKPYKRGTKIRGNLTAGVGHLLSRGANIFPEAEQWIDKPSIPQAVRDRWLDADTDIAENAVNSLVKVKLAPHQWDVLYSFAFNVGVTAFANSTLLKRINAGRLDQVPAELAKWNKTTIDGKKVTSDGLKKRRALETAYWLGGNKTITLTPAEYREKTAQPVATEIAEREVTKTTPIEAISTAGAVVGGAAGFANSEGWINIGIGVAIVVGVVLVGAIVVKRYLFTSR